MENHFESRIKFGLVGYGNIGKRHANIIKEFGILMAICDPDPSIRNFIWSCNELKAYPSIELMLENEPEIQAIVICSPNHLHVSHTLIALKNRKHVLCEKPMALNKEDCQEMLFASKKAGSILQIVKQNRFNPYIIKLQQLINYGVLGKISSFILNCSWNRNKDYYESSWRGNMEKDGGILFTQFSHFIDIINLLFGSSAKILGFADNILHKDYTEIEDTYVVAMKYSNGTIGSLHFSTNSFNGNLEGSLTVFGEYGTVKIGGQYLDKLDYLKISDLKLQNELDIELKSQNYYKVDPASLHRYVYQDFISNIQERNINDKKLLEAVQTIELIERINECVRKPIES